MYAVRESGSRAYHAGIVGKDVEFYMFFV
jgi:hypothetical protein